jgi:methyl-accepting chemotaxis protein
MSIHPPSDSPFSSFAGRTTAIVFFFVVAACIGLIGMSGYVKYQLDRSELALASPELQLSSDQQIFNKIRRDLGYSGFVGLAQTFANAHDPATLPDMKAQLKQANETLERLPEKAGAETRHDLQAILATFDAVMQKAEKSTTTGAPDFTVSDLAPLYAALPILESRVVSALASNRVVQQNQAQYWSTILTVIGWAGLVIASALAAGIFLVLRDRNSAPMRALAQSIKNMARGDMRTSIWGMERQDAIGELARAVDMARFHFSQLPDMSLLSEQGPVRIRFEGNTRSLFEAMMRVISRDSEQVHEQADNLTQAVNKQQEALAHVVERVEAVLQSVEKRAVSGDLQVRQALHSMLGSAESLKNAQEHASDQLNRIIPFMQERTQGLSEIAQITGKQVAQTLQSLTTSERGLRTSAEQSEEVIRKLSTTADTLGERMFGAVNLLQASGKVLAETTETAQSRLDLAIERISSISLPVAREADRVAKAPGEIVHQATIDPHAVERIDGAVASLESAHTRLETLIADQTKATRAHIDLLSAQSGGVLTQSTATTQPLSTTVAALEAAHTRLETLIADQTEATRAQIDRLTAQSGGLLTQSTATSQTLSTAVTALEAAHTRLETLITNQTEAARAHIDLLTTQSGGLLTQSTATSQTLSTAADRLREEQGKLDDMLAQLAAEIKNSHEVKATDSKLTVMIAAGIDELARQVASVTTALGALPQQIADQTPREPAFAAPLLADVKSGFAHIADSLSLLQGEIAVQTSREPAFAAPLLADVKSGFAVIAQNISILHDEIAALQEQADAAQKAPNNLNEQLRDHWFQMAGQIEATRSSLEQILVQQTDRVEAHLDSIAKNPVASAEPAYVRDVQNQLEQQTFILNELVTTLSLLDAHMQDLRSQLSASRQKAG